MKKLIWLVLCLWLLAGCSKVSSPAPVSEPKISITPNSSSLSAEDGTILLQKTAPLIIVTMDNQSVADAINRDLAELPGQWTSDLSAWETTIRNEYQPETGWDRWFCDIDAQAMRLDEQVLSVYFQCSKFAGGSHPALMADGATYNCQTGQRLALEDLMAEGHTPLELASLVHSALASSWEQLYDDYEALVSNSFAAKDFPCWYLNDTGLCFVFAPYDIGPYASGIITAEIPYEKLEEILQPAYLK